MTFHGHSMKTNLRVRAKVFLGWERATFLSGRLSGPFYSVWAAGAVWYSWPQRPVGDLSRAALMYISDWVRHADISCYEYAIVDGRMVAGGFSPINCRSIHSGVHGRP